MLRITTRASRTSARDAEVHDPPAVADRREVRRVHADAAAPGGTPAPPPLQQIPTRRRARASTCCRSTRHSQPVDLDLIDDIMRLPYRQRLAIILNELGTGLAGRGAGRSTRSIRSADPALQGDRQGARDPRRARTSVLADLGARLATPSLAPLARERAQRRRASSQQREPAARRRPPSGAGARGAASQRLPELPARAAPDDGAASARSSDQMTPVLDRPRRASRPTSTASSSALGPFSAAADPALDVARRGDASSAARRCRGRCRSSRTCGTFASAARPLSREPRRR